MKKLFCILLLLISFASVSYANYYFHGHGADDNLRLRLGKSPSYNQRFIYIDGVHHYFYIDGSGHRMEISE